MKAYSLQDSNALFDCIKELQEMYLLVLFFINKGLFV
jgi:hypothetical protein